MIADYFDYFKNRIIPIGRLKHKFAYQLVRLIQSKSQMDGATRLYWTDAERRDQYVLQAVETALSEQDNQVLINRWSG